MDFVRDSYIRFFQVPVSSTEPQEVVCLISHEFGTDSKMLNTTVRDVIDGEVIVWKTSRPTRQSASLSFQGAIETTVGNDAVSSYDKMVFYKRDRALLSFFIGNLDGENEWGFSGYITELSDGAEAGGIYSFSATIGITTIINEITT